MQTPKLTKKDWLSWLLPLTLLKVIVSLSTQISILKVPVAYAHTGTANAAMRTKHITSRSFSLTPGLMAALFLPSLHA